MGVKSYVAGLKADAVGGAIDTAMSALGGAATLVKYNEALDQAKDKADITRETTGIEGLNDEFLKNLQYDREYDKYQEKIDAHFDDLASMIDGNELLSERAKHSIKNEYLPNYKNQVASKAGVIMINGKMAEVEVEVEGFGKALASNESLDLNESLKGYREHLVDLGVYNEATIEKMVEDYSYSISPIKAMQLVQREYEKNLANDEFDFMASMDRAAAELGLDAFQKKEMKKQLATWKESFDKQQDERFSLQLEEINAGIAQAYDEGEIFDVSILDDAVTAMPARHRISVYKAKNTAYTNNDKLIEQHVRQLTDDYDEPTKQIWDLVGTMHDPYKRDEMGSSLLESYGESLLAEGRSLSEARGILQGYEAPVTAKARNKALADLTKAYLEREGDVTKVAKEMLANTGDRIDTIARIPQETLTDAKETAKQEAPAIDTSQLEERGEEYIEEHISEVAEAIAPKISIGLGLPRIEMGPFPSEGEQTTAMETPSEVVKEVARLIVEEQVDEIVRQTPDGEDQEASDNAADTTPVGGKSVDGEKQEEETPLSEPESEPESTSELTWEEPWWYAQYSEKRKERRKEIEEERAEYQAEIDAQIAAQDKSVREEAGIVEAEESGEYIRPLLERGMTQDELVSNMLQIIYDGYGPYITPDELSLIKSDDIREQMTMMASIKDSFLVDSPLALSFIDSLRRDSNVTKESLRRTVEGFVNKKFIKAETAEINGLTNKYAFADNPNGERLTGYLSDLASEVFPTKKGEVYNSDRSRLITVLSKAADDAIAMNPNLLGEDFDKLQYQLQQFATEEFAKKALSNLRDVAIYLSAGDITSQISNLEKSKVSTFMQDVQEGKYDVLINYDLLQQDEIRILRNRTRTEVLNALTKKMTTYQNYTELTKKGTMFDKLRVMANTSFLLAGGVLEKSLQGSFGIKAKDMKIMGKNWAFADPVADGLYFIATDTDVNTRGTLGWGMATADSDGVNNIVMFNDYVDPQLTYDIEMLEITVKASGFDRKKQQADRNRGSASSVLGLGGLGISPVKIQKELDDRSYGAETSLEQKKQELKQLTDDIMQYRYSLMGLGATALRTRL